VALSICKEARSPVHPALLDVRMPKMSGPGLLAALLDYLVPLQAAHNQVPIRVVLSALAGLNGNDGLEKGNTLLMIRRMWLHN